MVVVMVEDGNDGFDNYNGGYNGGYDVDNDNHDGDGSIVIFQEMIIETFIYLFVVLLTFLRFDDILNFNQKF